MRRRRDYCAGRHAGESGVRRREPSREQRGRGRDSGGATRGGPPPRGQWHTGGGEEAAAADAGSVGGGGRSARLLRATGRPAHLLRTCSDTYSAANVSCIASCEACISLAARPILRWERSTASEVMCPCISGESSSLRRCAHDGEGGRRASSSSSRRPRRGAGCGVPSCIRQRSGAH